MPFITSTAIVQVRSLSLYFVIYNTSSEGKATNHVLECIVGHLKGFLSLHVLSWTLIPLGEMFVLVALLSEIRRAATRVFQYPSHRIPYVRKLTRLPYLFLFRGWLRSRCIVCFVVAVVLSFHLGYII